MGCPDVSEVTLNDMSDINPSPIPPTPGQNGRHSADHILRCIFANEKFCILIKILLEFVPKGPIDNNQYCFR